MRRFMMWAAVFFAVLSQVSACGGSTDSSDPNVVQVTLSGGRTGVFRVSAASRFDPFGTPETDAQLAGYFVQDETDSTNAYFGVIAIRPAGNGLVDVLEIYAYPTIGTQNLDGDSGGPTAWISYGVPITNGTYDWDASAVYFLPEGRVTIQELSDERFVGTFSATGFGFDQSDDIVMSNGSFSFGAPAKKGIGSAVCRFAGC